MTAQRDHGIRPRSTHRAPVGADHRLFRGVPPAVPSDLALRIGMGSTPFAARRIPAATDCCSVARQFTRRTLLGWDLSSGLCDDTVQIASELVANAVRHGRPRGARAAADPPPTVWLALALRPRTLLCVVRDPSRRRPRLTCPAPLAERHRGLPIIDALSTSWGWTDDRGPHGKSVWARLTLPPA
ncbi:ATP-binding protein [Streptomyces sp. NPDC086091]|uniref:ATP-binding protein n=1 Tax=Streptomyces sp. NPDC086091 TaxID=3365751 RepID=UPI003825A4AF